MNNCNKYTAEDSQCPDTALDQSCSESDEAIGRALVESQCSDAAGGADEVPIEAAEEAGASRGGAMGSPLEAEGLRDGPAPSGSMQAVLLHEVAPSPRRLTRKASCVTVDSSDADPSTPSRTRRRVPESPSRALTISQFAVTPPAAGVVSTPAATRARYRTPASQNTIKQRPAAAKTEKKTGKKKMKKKKKKTLASTSPPAASPRPSRPAPAPRAKAPPAKARPPKAMFPGTDEGVAIWRKELKDFANSPADRQIFGAKISKIALALKIEPEMEACFDRCTCTKMIQRETSYIAQFKRKGADGRQCVLGQITLNDYKHKFPAVMNLLHFCAGAGYSENDWKRFKEIMKLENAAPQQDFKPAD